MSESNQLAVHTPVKASDQLAAFLGIEKGMMLETLKAQCFKNKRPDEVSDAQLAAFVSTANVLQVNPLVPGMLYAYPERNGGITPILGPDGVFKKLDEFIASGKLAGFECEVVMVDGKPDHADAIIYRTGDNKPAKYTAYFSEWSVTSNPNWQARPRHMLWVRAIKQAARQVIHGLPMDADEYEIAQMQNVTPEEDKPKKERPKAPPREAKGVASVVENVASNGGTVIDAETTPVTEPTPAAKAVTPEPAPAKPVESFTEAAAATAAQPRAFLKDAEEITANCEVTGADGMVINKTVDGVKTPFPSVQVKLKGDYIGIAFHVGGGVQAGNDVKPGPQWATGSAVRLKLRGKANAKGVVQVFVDAVEPAVAEMEG